MSPPRVSSKSIVVAAAAVVGALLLSNFYQRSSILLAPSGDREFSARANGESPQSEPTTAAQNESVLRQQRRFRCTVDDFLPRANASAGLTTAADRRFDELLQTLSSSSDLEHRLAAAILKAGNGYPDAIDDFAELLPTMDANRLLHWRLLDACAVRPTHELCASGDAEARVARVLGAEGEAWVKIAHYRLTRGNRQASFEAFSQAATTPEFVDYWSSEVELLFRALEAQGNRAAAPRLLEAIGYASALAEPHLAMVGTCQVAAAESESWAAVCLAYSKRKEATAQTPLGRSIGMGLQRALHQLAGDNTAAAGRPEARTKHDRVLARPRHARWRSPAGLR